LELVSAQVGPLARVLIYFLVGSRGRKHNLAQTLFSAGQNARLYGRRDAGRYHDKSYKKVMDFFETNSGPVRSLEIFKLGNRLDYKNWKRDSCGKLSTVTFISSN